MLLLGLLPKYFYLFKQVVLEYGFGLDEEVYDLLVGAEYQDAAVAGHVIVLDLNVAASCRPSSLLIVFEAEGGLIHRVDGQVVIPSLL